jgi:isopentenyl-diphosphate delta-isomerase
MSIKDRKKDHVDLTVKGDVSYTKSNGLEKYEFIHNALPEVDLEDISLETTLLGRNFSFPLFISSMTGGYSEAGAVNAIIAGFCQKHNLPFGVGSQRAMLEDPEQTESFAIVRREAPDAFIAANIGGAQLIGGLSDQHIEMLLSSIKADAIIVHLNPLQELMQPEGDRSFSGIEEGLTGLITKVDIPVIVKETGAGISAQVARRLLTLGTQVIDVAGAGGTSWSRVENLRERQTNPMHEFDDWGIPTAECVIGIHELRKSFQFELIASGGIHNPFDMVKALCLGADMTATAQPIIKSIVEGGEAQLDKLYTDWVKKTKIILTLIGCRTIKQLKSDHLKRV